MRTVLKILPGGLPESVQKFLKLEVPMNIRHWDCALFDGMSKFTDIAKYMRY